MSALYAVVYIPDFFLQAALRPTPDLHLKPVALVDGSSAKPVVLQLTEAARRQGVCEGMSPTQALARCAELVIKTRSVAQETVAARALLDCAYGFSPFIEATGEGICTLDLRGNPAVPVATDEETPSLFNDRSNDSHLHSWAGGILTRLLNLSLAGQIGVAATPLLALHAARVARPVLVARGRHIPAAPHPMAVSPESPSDFLAELPIEAIQPTPQTFAILKKWGIHTVGAFRMLGKDRLAERLGPEAIELFERATAAATRPLRLVNPPDTFEEAIDFEHEIETTQPLLFVLRRFLEQLTLRLEMVYLVAEQIKLRLIFSHGDDHERTFKVPAPTRNVVTLFRILDTHLEALRAEHPIVGLRLALSASLPVHQQFSLFESALHDPNHFYETLARLTGLVGSDRVGVPEVADTHRADSFRLRPVNFDLVANASQSGRPQSETAQKTKQGRDVVSRTMELVGLSLRRFRPRVPAQVQLQHNAPVVLKTNEFSRTIAAAQGPWRSSGDWWDQQRWQREEWDVQTSQGELYRLCHQGGQWFIEAVYD